MNNLKARVWDRKKKKMYYPSFNHILEWHYTLKGEPYFIFFDENFDPAGNKDIDVMLFTGKVDVLKKDIYAKDIVKILYTDWPSQPGDDKRTLEEYMEDIARTGIIVYKDCKYCIKFPDNAYGTIQPGRHGMIKIIGNKLENPGLLENICP